MTRQEALDLLNKFEFCCDFSECTNEWECEECGEALDIAIKALEHEQNCVKCKHYTETEDDTGVHGQCKATCSDNAQVKELKHKQTPCRECKYCRVAGDVKHYYYCDVWGAVVSESGYCNYGEKHE